MDNGGQKELRSIQHILLHEMQDGIYKYADMLPREEALADKLSISRTQLRDSLAQLEREGFITRRHGVGTIINRHVLSVKVRADMEIEFTDMIRLSGFTPQVRLIRVMLIHADETIADRLNVALNENVLLVSRVTLADGRPTIYCEDYLPERLIKTAAYPQSALEKPIFEFMREYCDTEPYMDLTDIRPASADARLAGILEVAEGTPLLYMDERDFDINGVAVLYARQYYIDGVITHTLLRRKF